MTLEVDLAWSLDGAPATTVHARFDAFEYVDGESAASFAILGGTGEMRHPGVPAHEATSVRLNVRRVPTRGGLRQHSSDGSRKWHLPIVIEVVPDGLTEPRDIVQAELELSSPKPGTAHAVDLKPLGELSPAALVQEGRRLAREGMGGTITAGPRKLPGAIRVHEIRCGRTENVAGDEADRLVARLQYVASDYPASVVDGEVVNLEEYFEQRRMLAECVALAESIGVSASNLTAVARVAALVADKASPPEVEKAARATARALARELGPHLSRPDPAPPEAVVGIFQARCAVCHGATGAADGPAAAGLLPPPANFQDEGLVNLLSPLRAYHALTHGVLGTGMPSFADLDDRERWGLAFWLQSLRHRPASTPTGPALSLPELAASTDLDLLEATDARGLAALRTGYLDAPRAPTAAPSAPPEVTGLAPGSSAPWPLLAAAALGVLAIVGFALGRRTLAVGALALAGVVAALGLVLPPASAPGDTAPAPETEAQRGPFIVKLNSPRPIEDGLMTLYLTKTDLAMAHVKNNQAVFDALEPRFYGRGVQILQVCSPEMEPTWPPFERFEVKPGVLELDVVEERAPFEVVFLWQNGAELDKHVLQLFSPGTDDVTLVAFVQFAVAAANAIREHDEWLPGDAELEVLSVHQQRVLDPLTPVESLSYEDNRFVLVQSPLAKRMTVAELLDRGRGPSADARP